MFAMKLAELSLPAFVDRAGVPNTTEVLRLWDDPRHTHLVLFADASAQEIALLPVGPKLPYRRPEDVADVEWDGLRAICYVRTRHTVEAGAAAVQATPAQTPNDDTLLELIEEGLAGAEPEIRQNVLGGLRARLLRLRERERELEHAFKTLSQREAYINDCENRLGSLAQVHAERESQIEQREHALEEKERQFFRRLGEDAPAAADDGFLREAR